jgi:hypothetical protein
MNQEALWQEINDLEDAMNDEESHYGKTPAWHMMKTEHSKLWKQATAEDAPAQPERRIVEIPYLAGNFYTTQHVVLDWICPVCGGKRGDVYRTLSYDGSLRVNCDGWQNPCGHVDKYPDVLKEAQAAFEAQQRTKAPEGVRCPACEGVGFDPPTMDMCGRCGGTGQIAKRTAQDDFVYGVETPDTPASVDGFLFGKDVDVKRLQAHELHEANGAPVEDKNARIRQLEAIIASHQASLLHEAHKSEKLQALLHEAAQVLAPVKDAVDYDTDLMKVRDIAMTYVLNSDGDEYVQIETESGFLEARHLRAIAEFAAKLKGVTDDAT